MSSLMSSKALSLPLTSSRPATYRLTAAYFAAFIALGLTVGSLGPTLPGLAEQTHVGLGAISYLVVLIALFLFLYVGAEVSFAGWIFTYTVKLHLSSATTAAYLTSLLWGSLTIGRMLIIPVATRFKAGSILISSLTGCLLSIGLMVVIPRSLGAVLIGTAGLGLSMASIFPTTLSYAGQRIRMTGQLTGWIVLVSSVGAMVVPLIIGQFFQSVGPGVLMTVIAVVLLGAVGVLLYVLRRPPAMQTRTTLNFPAQQN